MKVPSKEKRSLYRNKHLVLNHWYSRHRDRANEKLIHTADYELFNFTWKATVDTFIEQGILSDDSKVLDIGFGWGRTIVGLKLRFPNIDVRGIELCIEAIENSKIIFDRYLGGWSKIELEIGDAENLRYDHNCFDAILSTRVFQYLTYPERAMANVYRALVPGGRAVVMVPSKINPYQRFFYHTQVLAYSTVRKWFKNVGFKNILHGSIVFFPSKLHRFTSDSPWVKVERILTKVPLIRDFGGILWVRGEK